MHARPFEPLLRLAAFVVPAALFASEAANYRAQAVSFLAEVFPTLGRRDIREVAKTKFRLTSSFKYLMSSICRSSL